MTKPELVGPCAKSDQYTLRFELKSDDVVASLLAWWTNPYSAPKELRRRARTGRALLAVAAVVAALAVATWFSPLSFGTFRIAGLTAIVLLFVSVALAVWGMAHRRRTALPALVEDAMMASYTEAASYKYGHHVLTVGPAGVTHTCRSHELKMSWSGVRLLTEFGEGAMLYCSSGDYLPIPSRSFLSPEHRAEFINACEQWKRASDASTGETAFSRIVNYLAHHDVACPECAASLRGVRTATCAKCHRDILESDMPYYAAMPT